MASRVEVTSQQTHKEKSRQHADGKNGNPIWIFSWFHCLATIATGPNLIDTRPGAKRPIVTFQRCVGLLLWSSKYEAANDHNHRIGLCCAGLDGFHLFTATRR